MRTKFLGTHIRKIDRNGRVSVPSKFRAVLESDETNEAFLFPHPQETDELIGCDEAHLDLIVERMTPQDPQSDAFLDIGMSAFGEVDSFTIDKDGRIVLPVELRESIGLEGEVAFVGAGPLFSLMRPDLVKPKVARRRAQARAHQGMLAQRGAAGDKNT